MGTGPPGPRQGFPTREEIIDQIAKLITDLVDADSWRDSGGTIGSLREMGGVLIVSQTPEGIYEIRVLLERLHESIHANDFPPIAQSGATAAPSTPTLLSRENHATTQESRSTAYFNIMPILTKLAAGKPTPTPMGNERGASTYEAVDQIGLIHHGSRRSRILAGPGRLRLAP